MIMEGIPREYISRMRADGAYIYIYMVMCGVMSGRGGRLQGQ